MEGFPLKSSLPNPELHSLTQTGSSCTCVVDAIQAGREAGLHTQDHHRPSDTKRSAVPSVWKRGVGPYEVPSMRLNR